MEVTNTVTQNKGCLVGKKKRKPLVAAETEEAKKRRLTALFRVKMLNGVMATFDKLRVDEPPMDRVKSVDVSRLVLRQPGSTESVVSQDDEEMLVTYLGQMTENELKIRLGYVYMLHAGVTGAPNGPTRSIRDVADFMLEANLLAMRVEILDAEFANTELDAITSGNPIAKKAMIVSSAVDDNQMHVCHRIQPVSGLVVSLCGELCNKTGLPYLAWGVYNKQDKTWCKLCHAISICIERVY